MEQEIDKLKLCKGCKKEFHSKNYFRKYCDTNCKYKFRKRNKKRKTYTCIKCKNKRKESRYAHYCESCRKMVIKEQEKKLVIRARRYGKKYWLRNKDNKIFIASFTNFSPIS